MNCKVQVSGYDFPGELGVIKIVRDLCVWWNVKFNFCSFRRI
ncbi:MAG: hypothetical protein ACK4F9_03210 [Brevinematia bacterium]